MNAFVAKMAAAASPISGGGGGRQRSGGAGALWSVTNKNRDVSTGPLARQLARSLAPLTHLLARHCSLRSRAPLRSLIRFLTHFTHSLTRGTMNDLMSQNDLVLSYSAVDEMTPP